MMKVNGEAVKHVRTHADNHVTCLAGCVTPTECQDEPDSPPRRKGKGGRQRAPAPDASVDPKRAKRIMANRASAAKSKQKQKEKVQVKALSHSRMSSLKLAVHGLRSSVTACW